MPRNLWIKSFTRSFQLFGLLWVLSSWSGICEAQTAPVRILPLGDSLTKGGNPDTADEGGYRNRLHTLLSSAGYNVDFIGTQADANNPALPDTHHQGMAGYRIDQIQTGLTSWLNAVEDPDVVLLMVGTDDFGKEGELANAQQRLADLISSIATLRPYARIIVATLPVRIDNPDQELRQAAFNESIPAIVSNQIALGRRLSFIDLHPALETGDLSSDGVHPNATGYDKMADLWLPEIARVISPTGTSDPPELVSIAPLTDRNHLTLKFSKPLADESTDLANFNISPGLAISQALLDPVSRRSIMLTTDTQLPNTLYTLTVNGVHDRMPEPQPIAADTTATFFPELLLNGSFEAGLVGWVPSGHLGVSFASRYNTTSDGIRVATFNGANLSPNATLSQTVETVAGQAYTLTFDLGVFAFNSNSQTLQITANGTDRLWSRTITLNGIGKGDTLWVPQSLTFVADSAATTLTFRDLSLTTSSIDTLIDRVQIHPTTLSPGDLPTAQADAYTTQQDTALVVLAAGVLANDSAPADAQLTAILDAGPSHGTLKLNPNGSFIYQPAANFAGVDSFTYSAASGSLGSNLATVQITLNATEPPILVNGSFESDDAGWTFFGNQYVTSELPYVADDGAKLVAFNSGDSAPDAELSQTFATVAGQAYILAFDAGVFSYTLSQQVLELVVAGNENLLSQTITLVASGRAVNLWTPQRFTFVADSASTTLTFRDRSEFTTGIDLLLDHVRVIPAPSVAPTAPIIRFNPDGTPSTSLPAPSLDAPVLKISPTSTTLGMMAFQPGSYGLERSEDLATWESLGAIPITEVGRIEFQDVPNAASQATPAKQRFYRVSLAPSQ